MQQPEGSIDNTRLNHIYKLHKALYDLKEGLKA